MNENVMILSEADTVAVALTDWSAGETHAGLTATDEVKRGHKIASTAMKASAPPATRAEPCAFQMPRTVEGATPDTLRHRPKRPMRSLVRRRLLGQPARWPASS